MRNYCLSQEFNPISLARQSKDEVNLYQLVLCLYIIFKMCQLCSKAFSYSNFHIHEAYKFYTLALISTIMIIISRAVQLQFAQKVTDGNLQKQLYFPFNRDPFYQGWIIFNQIMGIISIYSVNLMYGLSSITWLMIAHKCDYNSLDQKAIQATDDDIQEERNRQKKDHNFYVRLRTFLLYVFIPITMLISVCLQLKNVQDSCLASKILTDITNFFIFLIFVYSLVDILRKRRNDKNTPLKIKIIWAYIIIAVTVRQVTSWILAIQDFAHPQKDYVSGQSKIATNIIIFVYSIGITTIPIFLLSYLADKQLEIQKTQIQRTERIIYTSTII